MSNYKKFAEGYAKLLSDMVYGGKPEFAAAFGAVRRFADRVRDA
jgi:hypothetical protein